MTYDVGTNPGSQHQNLHSPRSRGRRQWRPHFGKFPKSWRNRLNVPQRHVEAQPLRFGCPLCGAKRLSSVDTLVIVPSGDFVGT